MAPGFNFGGLTPGEKRSAVMSGVNTKKKSNFIDFTAGQSDPNIDEYRRDLESKKIIRDTRRKMNARERANVMPNLTDRERASAVMSGSGGRTAPMGNATMAMGGPDDGFLDFTEPSSGSRLNNPQRIKTTSERIAGIDNNQNIGRNLFGAVDRTAQSQLRQARARGDVMRADREVETEEDRILADAAAGMRADKLAAAAARRAKVQAFARGGVAYADNLRRESLQAARGGLFEASAAMATAERQGRASFSAEQRMIGQMFGQGEKIWGTNNQPVTINNDLNSSRSDPFDETAGMFGFGRNGERSGLF